MGDEQDAQVAGAAAGVDQFADHGLVGKVQGQQRLVAQQQPWVTGQRLADAAALLLPAGQFRERVVAVALGVDVADERVDRVPAGLTRPRDAPAVAVDAQPDEVPVLPATLDARTETLLMVRDGPAPDLRYALRLWSTPQQLQPGGVPLGDDIGYGPARLMRPDEVASVYRALVAVPESECIARFDPVAMNDAGVYPQIWDRAWTLPEGLLPALRSIVEQYAVATARGDGLLLALV